ncbi:PYGO1 protein, partial [Atractosteus spatula]|nr:PYGO1 protein [Atractosteus spatula]
MPPHMSPRMPAAYGGPYPMRNQLHPFAQNQMGMGFNRPPGFNYGHHESPGYGNHPVFNNNMPLPPNQPFRPGPGDHFSQMPPHSMTQNSDIGPNFGQEAVLLNRPGHSSTDPVYPCGICMNEVNDDQEAILCEASCQKWFHRVCTGMTETAYNLLTAEVSAVWGCDTCMEGKGVPLMRTRELAGQQSVNAEG